MFNDLMNYGYRCFSCGNHEPFGHNVGRRRGAAAPARGEGAQAGTPGAAGPPAGGDTALFDQRKYHRLVVEHARAKFLKGEYLGAVSEACKAFEGMVRKKSGIDDYGVQLMKGAFGDGGALEVDAAGLSAATRKSRQHGLESLCVGMVSGVRNPVSHEPESSLHIGREDALHILGTISHLCGQVDGTRRRRGRAPRKGGKGGTGEDAAGSRRAPRGGHGGEHHGTKGGEDGRLTARPDGSPGRAGDGGGPGAVDKNPEPKDDDSAFDQRGYHELVVEHARAKFLKGEYFSAVTECCKAFEELVQKKSGLAEDGADLMGKAFGPEGALAVNFPGLKGKTRENMRSGLMHLCMGMVANVRNPVSHELERKFCMGRKDALDILGTISYLCRQVEGTERRQESGTLPQKGGKRGPKAPAEKGPGTARPVSGDSNDGDAGLRAVGEPPPAPPGGGQAAQGAGGQGAPGQPRGSLEDPGTFLRAIRSHKISEVTGLAVRPETVEAGGTVDVTVTGTDIGEWYVWVCAEDGTVKSIPTPLEARDPDASTEGGVKRYAFSVITVNYDPGEYRVSVSVVDDMSAYGVRIKKFMVTARRAAKAGGGKTTGTL